MVAVTPALAAFMALRMPLRVLLESSMVMLTGSPEPAVIVIVPVPVSTEVISSKFTEADDWAIARLLTLIV